MPWWEIPGHLEARGGKLYIGGLDAAHLADEHGTPLHVYNGSRVVDNYRRFRDALTYFNPGRSIRIYFAMKTNSYPGILELLRDEGSWIDAVSPEEAEFAAELGYDPKKTLFTGSSVSNWDMMRILRLGARINIDSPSQMRRLQHIINERYDIYGIEKNGYPVSIRVDPGITGAGHVPENITTGNVTIHEERVPTKFGVDMSDVYELVDAAGKNGFVLSGLHFHIGSNWRNEEEIQAFLANLDKALEIGWETEKRTGHGLEFLDVGGGPGIRYRKGHPEFPLDRYAEETTRRVNQSGMDPPALAFEPGRYVSGDAGVLLAHVTDIKKKNGEVVIGTNTGFNHLPRPEIYNSHHHVVLCHAADAEPDGKFMVAGNICETGDYLSRDPIRREMVEPKEGDIVAFLNTGAYVKAMEMKGYNMRPPADELLLLGGKPHSIRRERIISEIEEL